MSLSWGHPCTFVGVFLASGFYLSVTFSSTLPLHPTSHPVPQVPSPTCPQSTQEISSIFNLQTILSGSGACSMVTLYLRLISSSEWVHIIFAILGLGYLNQNVFFLILSICFQMSLTLCFCFTPVRMAKIINTMTYAGEDIEKENFSPLLMGV